MAWIVPRGLNSGESEPMWNQDPPFISGVDTSSTHAMNRRHQDFQIGRRLPSASKRLEHPSSHDASAPGCGQGCAAQSNTALRTQTPQA